MAACETKKNVQRRERAGRKMVHLERIKRFDPDRGNLRPKIQLTNSIHQEGSLALVALDEREAHGRIDLARENSNDQTREPATAAEIPPMLGGRLCNLQKLRRIQKMPCPDLGKRALRYKIDRRVPFQQQGFQKFKPKNCFT